MIIDIITIFPEMFEGPMSTSIVGIARDKDLFELRIHDLRTWTHDRHRTVDDYPYGGGPGMVMKPEPLFEAVDAVRKLGPGEGTVVFFTPAGEPFSQDRARALATTDRLVFVCGRYEGFDERALTLADQTISIGDYVLAGGELPAMCVVEAVIRLLPGALGDDGSSVEESFADGLLEYPQYTRPASYCGMDVPEVLLSGDHGRIARYRREQAIRRTALVRPELLASAALTDEERDLAARLVDAVSGPRKDTHD